MNRISKQQAIVHAVGRYLGVGALGVLLAVSLAGCAFETGAEGDTSSTPTSSGDRTAAGEPLPGALPPAVARTSTGTPNTQPGALRGAAPAGPGQDPQPSPWIGTDNNDQGSPINRQQMGATVEHK